MGMIWIIVIIIMAVISYLCFGICLKFLWMWFPIMFCVIIGILISHFGGWAGSFAGVILIIFSINLTKLWHNTILYFKFEKIIDKMFHFGD